MFSHSMDDIRVLEAMHLLSEAGRMDLLIGPPGPAGSGRPARQASAGVAAAVAACSPPRRRRSGK